MKTFDSMKRFTSKIGSYLRPRNEEEVLEFAGQEFLLEIQETICKDMERLNITKSVLAGRLGWSVSRLNKFLGSDMRVSTLGRVLHALFKEEK